MENRRTFVVWISRQPAANEVVLEGHLEEVDTGRELRFRSAAQLVAILEQCMGPDAQKASA